MLTMNACDRLYVMCVVGCY